MQIQFSIQPARHCCQLKWGAGGEIQCTNLSLILLVNIESVGFGEMYIEYSTVEMQSDNG